MFPKMFDFAGAPERCFISKALKIIKEKLLIHRFHIVGIFLAIISGIIFTLNNCIIQWLKLDFSEIMLVRGSIQVLIFTLLLNKIFYREKGSMIHLDFNFSHVKDCLVALFDLLQQRRIIEQQNQLSTAVKFTGTEQKKRYFVTKIVLTYCEKELLQ